MGLLFCGTGAILGGRTGKGSRKWRAVRKWRFSNGWKKASVIFQRLENGERWKIERSCEPKACETKLGVGGRRSWRNGGQDLREEGKDNGENAWMVRFFLFRRQACLYKAASCLLTLRVGHRHQIGAACSDATSQASVGVRENNEGIQENRVILGIDLATMRFCLLVIAVDLTSQT